MNREQYTLKPVLINLSKCLQWNKIISQSFILCHLEQFLVFYDPEG